MRSDQQIKIQLQELEEADERESIRKRQGSRKVSDFEGISEWVPRSRIIEHTIGPTQHTNQQYKSIDQNQRTKLYFPSLPKVPAAHASNFLSLHQQQQPSTLSPQPPIRQLKLHPIQLQMPGDDTQINRQAVSCCMRSLERKDYRLDGRTIDNVYRLRDLRERNLEKKSQLQMVEHKPHSFIQRLFRTKVYNRRGVGERADIFSDAHFQGGNTGRYRVHD